MMDTLLTTPAAYQVIADFTKTIDFDQTSDPLLGSLLATLAAKGESIIRNVRQIDRGYERVDEKMKLLGARIERVVE